MDGAETVNITFTATRVVDDARKGSQTEERFEAGKSYDLPSRSADRWVKRGVAHFTTDDDAAKGAGASSDVALKMQDADRFDPNASRVAAAGTGTATDSTGGGNGGRSGEAPDYSAMNKADLKSLADSRGIAGTSSASKPDLQKLLERNDVVTNAIAAREFDTLHVDELHAYAEKEQIDLTGKSSKTDIVKAIGDHAEKPAA
jgi:hypothetical protein